MADFGIFTNLRIFHFDKIPDMCAFTNFRFRTKVRKWTDISMTFYKTAFNHRVFNDYVVFDRAVNDA